MTLTQAAALSESLPAPRVADGPPADDARVEEWVEALCKLNPNA